MNSVNKIVLSKLMYGDDIYQKVGAQIGLLMSSGYVCTVVENIPGIIEISYEFINIQMGLPYPYWLTPAEANYVRAFHDNNEMKKIQQIMADDNASALTDILNNTKNGNKGGGTNA